MDFGDRFAKNDKIICVSQLFFVTLPPNSCKMRRNDFIFRSLASGSSGNCYYLGTREQGILVDAGISARTIQKHLRSMGLDFANIAGVLVTHDHADHIRAVGTLGERVHLPIYATPLIHEGIDRNYGVREKLKTSRKYFEKSARWELPLLCAEHHEAEGVPIMQIQTFDISHDSTECVGYVIDFMEQRWMIATDCGSPNADMEYALQTSNHIVLEANHDEHMLLNGPYPTYLKERILSPRGHQSNVTCGELLARNYHSGMEHIWLCHLSLENNDPEVAYQTVSERLAAVGVHAGEDVYLEALPRTQPNETMVLNNNV